jgi:hypothetical protein
MKCYGHFDLDLDTLAVAAERSGINGDLPALSNPQTAPRELAIYIEVDYGARRRTLADKRRKIGKKVIVVFFVAPAAEERNRGKQFQVFAG